MAKKKATTKAKPATIGERIVCKVASAKLENLRKVNSPTYIYGRMYVEAIDRAIQRAATYAMIQERKSICNGIKRRQELCKQLPQNPEVVLHSLMQYACGEGAPVRGDVKL